MHHPYTVRDLEAVTVVVTDQEHDAAYERAVQNRRPFTVVDQRRGLACTATVDTGPSPQHFNPRLLGSAWRAFGPQLTAGRATGATMTNNILQLHGLAPAHAVIWARAILDALNGNTAILEAIGHDNRG